MKTLVQSIVQPADRARTTAAVAIDGLVLAHASALDSAGRRMSGADSFSAELALCFAQLETTLHVVETTLGDIVKVNCFLASEQLVPEFRQAYLDTFSGGTLPILQMLITELPGGTRVLLDVVAEPAGR